MLYFAFFKQHFVILSILKNYPQNAGNGISKTPNFKIFWRCMPLDPLRGVSCLQHSHWVWGHNSMTSHLWSASPLPLVPSTSNFSRVSIWNQLQFWPLTSHTLIYCFNGTSIFIIWGNHDKLMTILKGSLAYM